MTVILSCLPHTLSGPPVGKALGHMPPLPSGPNQGLLSLSEPVQQDTSSSLLVLAEFHPSDRPTYQVQRLPGVSDIFLRAGICSQPLRGSSSDKTGLVYFSAVGHSETRARNRRVQSLPPHHYCSAGAESERRRATCPVPDCGATTARAGPGGKGPCRAGLPRASDRVSSCLWQVLLHPC